MKTAVDYYIMYNIESRQPGVGYRYVSKQFKVGKPDLREEVEARLDYYCNEDDDSEILKKRGSKKKEKEEGKNMKYYEKGA